MKRFHLAILALFAAVLVTTAPAHAYKDTLFDVLPFTNTGVGVTTVITDTQGDIHTYDGALDVARLEEHADAAVRIASYTLVYEGEELLSVTLHDFEVVRESVPGGGYAGVTRAAGVLTNGYYAVGFGYNEDYEAFLTGLTNENYAKTQDAIVKAALTERGISIKDLGYIDTEKMSTNFYAGTGDSQLCWAAATSNILWYTGWAQQVKNGDSTQRFKSEDDVLDLFMDTFVDDGGWEEYGFTWFLNGFYRYSDYLKNPEEESGGFFPEYAAESLVTPYSLKNHPQDIRSAFRDLCNGAGITLGLDWYKDGSRNGGHAITLWGYIQKKDADQGAFSKDNYVALIISDSDDNAVDRLSDEEKYKDEAGRRVAPNTLRFLPMRPASVGTISTWELGYDSDYVGYLTDLTALKAYDENIPKEPVNGSTKNRRNSVDLIPAELFINNSSKFDAFLRGTEIKIDPDIENRGGVDYQADAITYTAALKKDGTPLCSSSRTITLEEGRLKSGNRCWGELSLGTVDEAGDYTICITVDCVDGEAYYTNNSREWTITVSDTPEAKLRLMLPTEDGKSIGEDPEIVINGNWNIDGRFRFGVRNEGVAGTNYWVAMVACRKGQPYSTSLRLCSWATMQIQPNAFRGNFHMPDLLEQTKEALQNGVYEIWAEAYIGEEFSGNLVDSLKVGTLTIVSNVSVTTGDTAPTNATPFCVPMTASVAMPENLGTSFKVGMLTSLNPYEGWAELAANGYPTYRWENYMGDGFTQDLSKDFAPGNTVYYRAILQFLDDSKRNLGEPIMGEVMSYTVPEEAANQVTEYLPRGISKIPEAANDVKIVRFVAPFTGSYDITLQNIKEPRAGEYKLGVSFWREKVEEGEEYGEWKWLSADEYYLYLQEGEEAYVRFDPESHPGGYAEGSPVVSGYTLSISLRDARIVSLGESSKISGWFTSTGNLAVVNTIAHSAAVNATSPVFVAGYNADGKMLFLRQFNDEDIKNFPAANVATLKFFWLNENSQPKCSAIEVPIAAPEP